MSLSYEITNWENGKTVLKAEHLRKIEKGITDIISENDAIYKDEDIRKSNEKQRQEEHSRKMNEVSEVVSDIQKDYDSLQKIIIDENASANLQNQINQTNSQLAHNVNDISELNNSNNIKFANSIVNIDNIIKEAIEGKYSTVRIPAGEYVITKPIEASALDASKHRSSVKIIGDGIGKTIIWSEISDGDYCIKHTQSLEQAKNYKFSRGLEIKDLSIKAKANSDCGGISLKGAFYCTIKNVEITNMKQHGIYIPYDKSLDAESGFGSGCDSYASAYSKFINVIIQGCDGWGYKNEIWGSHPNIENCTIADNKSGGIYISCSAGRIYNSGISHNGENNPDGGGILITYNDYYSQTPHNNIIENCEIDTNYNYQVHFKDCMMNKMQRCRLIDRELSSTLNYHGNCVIKFGGGDKIDSYSNIVDNCYIRLNQQTNLPNMFIIDFNKRAIQCEVTRIKYDIGRNSNVILASGTGIRNKITDPYNRDIWENRPFPKNVFTQVRFDYQSEQTVNIPKNVYTHIPFDFVILDETKHFDLNTSSFKSNDVAGIYNISGYIHLLGEFASNKYIEVVLKESNDGLSWNTIKRNTHYLTNGVTKQLIQFNFIYSLLQNKYIRIELYHNNNTDLQIDRGFSFNDFSVTKVG